MRARVGHASNGNRALVSSSTLLDVFECPRNGRVCRAVSDKFTALAALQMSCFGTFPPFPEKQKKKETRPRLSKEGKGEPVLPPTSR